MDAILIPLSASELVALQAGKVVATTRVRDPKDDAPVTLTVLIQPPRLASEPGT